VANKLKVLLLGSYPLGELKHRVRFWRDPSSLSTTWNLNLLKGLSQFREVEVHFATNAPLLETMHLEGDGYFIHLVGHLPRVDLLDRFTLLRYSLFNISRLIKRIKPDVVHGSGTDHEYGFIAVKSGLPSVVTVHGPMSLIHREFPFPWVSVNRVFAKYEPSILQAANAVIFPTERIAQFLRHHLRGITRIIPNAVTSAAFALESSSVTKDVDIIWVGKIYPLKRPHYLLEAIKLLRDEGVPVCARLVGAVSDRDYFSRIQNYVKDNHLENSVEFLAPLKNEEIIALMKKSKMLVMCSAFENAPMVVAEAQAVGIPVIATNVGGVESMIEHGKTGFLVEKDNLPSLASAIRRILLNQQDIKSVIQNAQAYAKATYEPMIVASKTAEVYRDVYERCRHER